MEKKKVILAVAGILAVVFLATAILFHGHSVGGYGMRTVAPAVGYGGWHGDWGHHH